MAVNRLTRVGFKLFHGRWVILLVVACLLLTSTPGRAERGVGVNLGQIQVDDPLTGGGGYSLPTLGVINTGDESGYYEVMIGHIQDQAEKRPPESWFTFQPRHFFLNPGEIQNVRIRLTLPTNAVPGDYFALIEAHPVADGQGATIGAAAATKLSFSVTPSSWVQAQRVRLNRWLDDSEPLSYFALGVLLSLIVIVTVRRFISIEIRVGRR